MNYENSVKSPIHIVESNMGTRQLMRSKDAVLSLVIMDKMSGLSSIIEILKDGTVEVIGSWQLINLLALQMPHLHNTDGKSSLPDGATIYVRDGNGDRQKYIPISVKGA